MELNDLLESVNILEYISQYVDLEKNGEEYWGISPFTFPPEHTPSFSVRAESGQFYDFSAGFGGNILTFIKHFHKCSQTEAIERLRKYAGYKGTIGESHNNLAAISICKSFSRNKPQKTQQKGEVLADDYMDRYEKDENNLAEWKKEGISNESLNKFQVCYDRFSNRLVYPIRGIDGKIVNVGGRTLEPDWKENGLRKYTYFFKWGSLNTIYGLAENLDTVKKRREIILFEGCKSVLLADTWGVYNTGAILTSHLNKNQVKILAKLGCRVVFALDKDVKIRDDRNIKMLKSYVNVEYIWDRGGLLDEKDSPVDKGKEIFEKLYEQRIRYR